jgi:hypothetical protein
MDDNYYLDRLTGQGKYVRRPVSKDWIRYWCGPNSAIVNPPFVRNQNGQRVRSQFRDEDISFIRAACQRNGDEATPEFYEALLCRVLRHQEADGYANEGFFFALQHDHLCSILGRRLYGRR